MKTLTVVLPEEQKLNSNVGEQERALNKATEKKNATVSPVDTWSFQKQIYRVPEGEFPSALAAAFLPSEKLPRPQFPQRYDENKFSIYGQVLANKEKEPQWAAMVEHKNEVIASITADGESFRIQLANLDGKTHSVSREELMEVVEGAKDELELGKFLPASK